MRIVAAAMEDDECLFVNNREWRNDERIGMNAGGFHVRGRVVSCHDCETAQELSEQCISKKIKGISFIDLLPSRNKASEAHCKLTYFWIQGSSAKTLFDTPHTILFGQ